MVTLLLFALTISLSQCAFAANNQTSLSFSSSDINSASSNVKKHIEKYNKLPSKVNVKNTYVSVPQFLHLMTTNLQNIKSGKKVSVSLKTVKDPSTNSENMKLGNLKKSEYLSLNSKIKSYINSHGKAPTSVKSTVGTVGYNNLVYNYSKILAFYKSNKRLPNYVSAKPFASSSGWTSLSRYTYHHQTTDYTCGPSALKMALSHYGINVSEKWLAQKAKSNYYTGTSQSGMINAIKAVNAKYGTKFSLPKQKFTGWNSIKSYLSKGVPVVVRARSFLDTYGTHYVMITGINFKTGKVRLADSSWNGKGTFSVKDKGVKIHEITLSNLQSRLNWIVNRGTTSPIMPLIKK